MCIRTKSIKTQSKLRKRERRYIEEEKLIRQERERERGKKGMVEDRAFTRWEV